LIDKDRIKITISILLLSEIARALKKARWENEEICEALELLDGIIELCGIAVIPVNILIIKSAQNLVVNYGLYSADAIHTATAMLTESNYFVSSDEHHFRENLKMHLDFRGVKSLRLSEVDGIEIPIH
jgi:predicted nucleic acid-binding protein